MQHQTGIETVAASYAHSIEDWVACRDASNGQREVHRKGEVYLPRLGGQDADEYKAYLLRSTFLGAFGRTVEAFSGMIFRRDPVIKLPGKMEEWQKDVTGDGIDLVSFASMVVDESLITARSGILVDFPSTDGYGDLTIAEAERLKLVPFLRLYTAESIVNWRFGDLPNGGYGVVKVVLLEHVEEESVSNEFETVELRQYRVLDFHEGEYRQRIYRQDQKGATKRRTGVVDANREEKPTGETPNADSLYTGQKISGYHLYEVFPQIGGKRLNYLPFTFINVRTLTANVEKPPMLDLVNQNFQHYRISADYYHGLHYVGLPTPYITGVSADEAPTQIGPSQIWHLSNPESKVGYLQVDAAGFQSLREEMVAIEGRMAAMGARMLAPEKSGVEAAETLNIKSRGEHSTLSKISGTVSRGIEQALIIARDWMSTSGEVVFELNKDFVAATLTSGDITALLGAWQAGAISKEVLFDKLKQGEIIREDVEFEDHEEAIEEGAEDLAGMFGATEESQDQAGSRSPAGEQDEEALVDQEDPEGSE
ncbi:DUF4055 domain-containing protein [Roseibium aggregatum]|uniref:DUF4055 domain-containing protein n=1 Tax=Roseibium aggregatum TaxID=187304 RepID=A0A0M6Y7U7_9HYPH|nr:DUF4055 domain-containing protein [Roseibium aggregatum]CTQ45748.1 hypothetical protein LAL4801_04203 [Roseibium aggregatum]